MNKYQEAYKRLSSRTYQYADTEGVYEDINVLGELVEKETPKETIWGEEIEKEFGLRYLGPKCPTCGKFVTKRETFFYGEEYNYCGFCGQRIDWGETGTDALHPAAMSEKEVELALAELRAQDWSEDETD